jgi:hypothetical protein
MRGAVLRLQYGRQRIARWAVEATWYTDSCGDEKVVEFTSQPRAERGRFQIPARNRSVRISDIAVNCLNLYIGLERNPAMTTHVLLFVELSDHDRKAAKTFDKLGKGDQVEVRVRRKSGEDQVVKLPPKAAALLETALGHLLQGERVAILAEDQELSPNDAADILGISRPLVVHRMDVGDLPFRYVGKHRRTKLKDVLALKTRIEAQQAAMEALADDAEDLRRRHGV